MQLQSRLSHAGSAATAREAAITCVSSRACQLEAESVFFNVSINHAPDSACIAALFSIPSMVNAFEAPYHFVTKGVGTLLSVFTGLCHVYSNSMPSKQKTWKDNNVKWSQR